MLKLLLKGLKSFSGYIFVVWPQYTNSIAKIFTAHEIYCSLKVPLSSYNLRGCKNPTCVFYCNIGYVFMSFLTILKLYILTNYFKISNLINTYGFITLLNASCKTISDSRIFKFHELAFLENDYIYLHVCGLILQVSLIFIRPA